MWLVILRAAERWVPDDNMLGEEPAIVRREGHVLVEHTDGSSHTLQDDVQMTTNPGFAAVVNGPFRDDEMRVVEQLKAEGVMKSLHRRAAGPGVVIVLEGESVDAIRGRMSTLPFVREGLMTLEYEEVYEI